MPDRLTRAEEQLAHLSQSVDELSDIVAAQQGTIARLERRLALLTAREAEREIEAGAAPPLSDPPPPHYGG